jgi:hypothetical protein
MAPRGPLEAACRAARAAGYVFGRCNPVVGENTIRALLIRRQAGLLACCGASVLKHMWAIAVHVSGREVYPD